MHIQSVKQQAIMMMNLVLSFAGVWAFFYFATHTTLQTQGAVRNACISIYLFSCCVQIAKAPKNSGQRALAATIAALVALIAEIWLFLKADIFYMTFKEKNEAIKTKRQLENTLARSLELGKEKPVAGKKQD